MGELEKEGCCFQTLGAPCGFCENKGTSFKSFDICVLSELRAAHHLV